jgi:cytochrome c oxidase subunit 4
MTNKIVAKKVYFTTFAILIALTFTTYGMAFVDLGRLNVVVALTIAFAKGMLVALFFMHLRYSEKVMWVVMLGALFWLGLLMLLTLNDYVTRVWLMYPNRAPL